MIEFVDTIYHGLGRDKVPRIPKTSRIDLTSAAKDIKSFLLEAGAHALKIQKDIDRQYKQGEQAVTQADLDISKMAAERLSHWLGQDGHVLIDEESVDTISTPAEVFATTRYQWVLDPVDGTAGYALGRDRWSVSLGLIEDGVPVGGGFYMPALNALIMVEEGRAVYTNTKTGEKSPMPQAKAMDVNSQIFIETYYGFENYKNAHERHARIWLNTPECAVQGGYSTFMHQAAGTSIFELYSIWDAAGIAAIARAAGYKIMSLEDGHYWEAMEAKDFSDNWKLNSKWIVAHPDNFEAIRGALTGK